MSFKRAINELAMFCKKADVTGTPRLSLSFDTERDVAYFERELRRELETEVQAWPATLPPSHGEFRLYGITIRIYS